MIRRLFVVIFHFFPVKKFTRVHQSSSNFNRLDASLSHPGDAQVSSHDPLSETNVTGNQTRSRKQPTGPSTRDISTLARPLVNDAAANPSNQIHNALLLHSYLSYVNRKHKQHQFLLKTASGAGRISKWCCLPLTQMSPHFAFAITVRAY